MRKQFETRASTWIDILFIETNWIFFVDSNKVIHLNVVFTTVLSTEFIRLKGVNRMGCQNQSTSILYLLCLYR